MNELCCWVINTDLATLVALNGTRKCTAGLSTPSRLVISVLFIARSVTFAGWQSYRANEQAPISNNSVCANKNKSARISLLAYTAARLFFIPWRYPIKSTQGRCSAKLDACIFLTKVYDKNCKWQMTLYVCELRLHFYRHNIPFRFSVRIHLKLHTQL